jgi:hypothetical protein
MQTVLPGWQPVRGLLLPAQLQPQRQLAQWHQLSTVAASWDPVDQYQVD